MAEALILVVEDEPTIVEVVVRYLQREGFRTLTASDGPSALAAVVRERPSLVVLDVMLPGFDGLELLRRLRASGSLPVVLLTARGEEIDRVLGLELGADDYITKPFNPRELTIRARNLLGRTMRVGSTETAASHVENYRFNGWTLDINSRSLLPPSGEAIRLPRSEFRALLHFCENPGQIQTRADLLMKMTGRELKAHDRTVDVTIRRIRKHFESVAETPEIIATIHGEGYRFCGTLDD